MLTTTALGPLAKLISRQMLEKSICRLVASDQARQQENVGN